MGDTEPVVDRRPSMPRRSPYCTIISGLNAKSDGRPPICLRICTRFGLGYCCAEIFRITAKDTAQEIFEIRSGFLHSICFLKWSRAHQEERSIFWGVRSPILRKHAFICRQIAMECLLFQLDFPSSSINIRLYILDTLYVDIEKILEIFW